MLEDRQLSQMFLRKGLIDDATLQKATQISSSRGTSLYDTLLGERMVDEEKAIVAVSKQLNLPCVSLKEFEANPKILALVAMDLAERLRLMPLGLTEEDGERKLFVAMANPLDLEAIELVSKASGFPVVQLLAGPSDVREAIARSYGTSASSAQAGASGAAGLDVGSMLDSAFGDEPEAASRDATPARGKPATEGLDLGLGGFSLDFGDLGLSVGSADNKSSGSPPRREDIHNRMTLPAGTELPGAAAFKRVPTAGASADPLASLKSGRSSASSSSSPAASPGDSEVGLDDRSSSSPLDDWGDLATFGLEEDEESGSSRLHSSSQAPLMRTENSTVRYVADPSLQRSDREGFPHNVPSSDLIRATVSLLVQKGILTEKQIMEEVKKIRHGQRRRR